MAEPRGRWQPTAHQGKRPTAATDAEIDRLVYELYGLSAEESAIVEEATA